MFRSLVILLCFCLATPALANNVRIVQEKLKEGGYEVGKVDGKFGKVTFRAIREYEADWDIIVTGRVTEELLARLKREHPDTRPRLQKVDNAKCKIWNAYPRARESIVFEPCDSDGPINGKGEVIWRWFERGDWQSARYSGEFSEGKLNGKGVLNYPDGHEYIGEFRNDLRHGQGTLELARGDRYEGAWKDNKPHGNGVYFRNGERFEGSWKMGCYRKGKNRFALSTSRKSCGFK